jgi:F0F1-type ATP synthase membrane subunit b/b'
MMTEVEDRAKKAQEAKDALAEANKKLDGARRRAGGIKPVGQMSPDEIKAERRHRGLKNNY